MKNINVALMIISLIFIVSCEDHSELESLEIENNRLNIELRELEDELASYSNSMVIPYDSLEKYVVTTTFGPPQIKKGEIDTFHTSLALVKFPDDINIEWSITDGGAKLVEKNYSSLMRTVCHRFDTSGTKKVFGNYELTFPNGKKTEMVWGRYVDEKK